MNMTTKKADDDMVKLFAHKISEKDLLKEFSKKPYFLSNKSNYFIKYQYGGIKNE